MKKSSYEGLQENIRKSKTPAIEVWKNQYSGRRYLVHIDIPEFTCICPKTGLPDFAAVSIEYVPAQCCIELKSLKDYMTFYRSVGIFHEHFVNKLMDDLVKASRPHWAKVIARFNPRGGITTTVTREYAAK